MKMKTAFGGNISRYFFCLSFILLIANALQAQTALLPKECKFKIGNDMSWATQSYNDTTWGKMPLGTGMKISDTLKNVFAWVRIKITIPVSMKPLAEKGNGIKLNLGRIDDVDQTFFNGKQIGQTGSFPPDYESKYDADRSYIIPLDLVKWGKQNLIAVRIFSPDNTGIGMYQGPYNYGPIQWSDFMTMEQTIAETTKNGFVTKVKFTNTGFYSFDGTIKYIVADINNKELFSETKLLQIPAQKGFVYEVAFAEYKPVKDIIFKVGFTVTDKEGTATYTNQQLYLADKQLSLEVADEPKPVVENKVKDAFTSVSFQHQQLSGYLGTRMNQNLTERLLKLDEAGTLDGYLQRPGHHPWAGEHIGKYLETASNAWKTTGNEKLKTQMDRMAFQLINSQLQDGYLGTYTPDEYWTSWDVWSHKYNLYGLLGYYKATGYKPALDACKKAADLLCAAFGKNPGQRDIILSGTHMGMAATSVLDPMVELYKYTGDKKYLDFCNYILTAMEQDNGPKIIISLLATGKVTKVGNGKAYEMLSNFVGITNLYRLTADENLLKPMLIAWQDIVKNRLYITGTASSHEYFQDDAVLPADDKSSMGEGCVTTTWLQFNKILFDITGDYKYYEQIEKTIYNQLLAAENPRTGCVSYYTPLMGKKPYTCNISCCQSSVPRGIAMLPYFTFGNLKNVPTLLIYESAEYKESITTTDKKTVTLALTVESSFPENGNSVLTVNVSQAASFPIALRVPSWCSSFKATVGGKPYTGTANTSLIIDRVWNAGDKITVSFQLPVQLLPGGKSYPDQIAFQIGPQVLALDSLLNIEVLKKYQINPAQKLTIEKPGGKNNSTLLPAQWIGKQAYTVNITDKTAIAEKPKLVLVPFADASQTEGVMKVWLPLNIPK
jgi:hypothetical protein